MPDLPSAPGSVPFVLTQEYRKRSKHDSDNTWGRPFINHYIIGPKIGEGVHGNVKLAVDVKDKRQVAVKTVKRSNPQDRYGMLKKGKFPRSGQHLSHTERITSTENKIRKEIAIMKKCHHPHIVQLYEVIDDRTHKKVIMIMEFMGGGEVIWRKFSHMESNGFKVYTSTLTVDQSRRIIRDVVLGLEYLHFNGIIHRDIKPANLLWSTDRRTVKIGDFGVSHFSYAQTLATAGQRARSPASRGELLDPRDVVLLDEGDIAKTAGTPPFFAPEIVSDLTTEDGRAPPRRIIGFPIDVWALGVTLYCLLFGEPPWHPERFDKNEWQLYKAICSTDWTAPTTMGIDEIPTGGRHPPDRDIPLRTRKGKEVAQPEGALVIGLLDRLLQKDPNKRITLHDVKMYPWFTRDIENPKEWHQRTKPQLHARLYATDTESKTALTGMRIRWRETLVSALSRTIRPISSIGSIGRSGGRAAVTTGSVNPGAKKDKDKPKARANPPGPRTSSTPHVPTVRSPAASVHGVGGTTRSRQPASRRGSDSLTAPTSTGASGATSPAVSAAGESRGWRGTAARMSQIFRVIPSAGPSRAASALNSPTDASPPQSPPRTGFVPREGAMLARAGSTSVLFPRSTADAPGSAGGRSGSAHADMRATYGVGGGQLSGQMRASSYGEAADYAAGVYAARAAADLLSVHSLDGVPDEDAHLLGAGGVADPRAPLCNLFPPLSPTLGARALSPPAGRGPAYMGGSPPASSAYGEVDSSSSSDSDEDELPRRHSQDDFGISPITESLHEYTPDDQWDTPPAGPNGHTARTSSHSVYDSQADGAHDPRAGHAYEREYETAESSSLGEELPAGYGSPRSVYDEGAESDGSGAPIEIRPRKRRPSVARVLSAAASPLPPRSPAPAAVAG